jgi:uncharacterized protein
MPTESLISSVLRPTLTGVTLAIRAQPGAKKTAITGIYGQGPTSQLKIAVQAPPVEGKANAALIAFLAEAFALPKNKVELLTGQSSRSKVFFLRGVDTKRAELLLSRLLVDKQTAI